MAFFDRPLFMWRKYQRVTDQEENETSDLKVGTNRRAYARSRGNSLIWIMMTLVLAGLTAFFFSRTVQINRRGSFFGGYSSEMLLALPSIRVTQIRFTGGIKFHDNGTMYRDNGAGPRYVGPPDPEIDANWEALVGTRYLAFTHDQKSSFQVDMDRDSNDGLYRAGPDAFHSLHCVNKLRQTIDAYMYNMPAKVDESHGNVLHIEHCLDFLRQLVACSSDLTPIPLIYSKGAGQAVPDFEQVHTCRNFQAVHDWAMKQNENALKSVEGTGVGKSLIP